MSQKNKIESVPWQIIFVLGFNAYANKMVWIWRGRKEFIQKERDTYWTFVHGI